MDERQGRERTATTRRGKKHGPAGVYQRGGGEVKGDSGREECIANTLLRSTGEAVANSEAYPVRIPFNLAASMIEGLGRKLLSTAIALLYVLIPQLMAVPAAALSVIQLLSLAN